MRNAHVRIAGTGLVLLLTVMVPFAAAAKPGSGISTGYGQVFYPNPVAFLDDQTLTDQKDANTAELQPAYVMVELTDLDGTGYLRGNWADVVCSTGPLAYSSTNRFIYSRDDDRFEQVMAYFWVTTAQKYIQSLGFGIDRAPINMEPQNVRINQWGVDNSYSWDKHDVMRFGKGGIDDAEDADVILHEYGHAMMDSQATPFGSFGYTPESGAIGEGFSDYWAAVVTDIFAPSSDPACIADWDSVSYTSTIPHCLRRIDRDLYYPDDLNGAVHHDGMIWSRALWDIYSALGAETANTVVLQSHFSFLSDTTMPEAAWVTVETAEQLYGTDVSQVVQAAFEARGIIAL